MDGGEENKEEVIPPYILFLLDFDMNVHRFQRYLCLETLIMKHPTILEWTLHVTHLSRLSDTESVALIHWS